MYSCIFMSEDTTEAAGIQSALEKEHINIIHSRPSYANYLKTLQYLPNLIIIELPRSYSNELNYLQMVKQHRVIRQIPIVCYGAAMAPATVEGLKKIGVDEYFKTPLEISVFINVLLVHLKKRVAFHRA